MGYLVLAGVVFGVNLLPAVGPPTWAVLVFFRLQSSLAAVPLVLIGALAAASGRLVLAYGSRRFRSRLSEQRIENLEAVRDAVGGSRKRAAAGLGLPRGVAEGRLGSNPRGPTRLPRGRAQFGESA